MQVFEIGYYDGMDDMEGPLCSTRELAEQILTDKGYKPDPTKHTSSRWAKVDMSDLDDEGNGWQMWAFIRDRDVVTAANASGTAAASAECEVE